ncbi:NADP-dependent oxidoreductase [Humibacter soli]
MSADNVEIPVQMRALRAHERGGPEVLVYEDAPVPALRGDDEVLVRVGAASITFDELTWPETWESGGVDRTPIIPSHEFAGVVVAVGTSVTGFAVGDRVFGLAPFDRDGAAAEYVAVPSSALAHLSDGVTGITAAAAVLPALTAMEAVDEHLAISEGQRLLVRGGAGGVGAFVVQFAARLGIQVTATSRSDSAVARLKELGADTVLVGGEPESIETASYDAAIDTVGAGTPEWLYRGVRAGGRLITLQEPPSDELAAKYGVDARFFVVRTDPATLARLGELLAAGDLEVAVAATYPLADGRAAYESRGHATAPGKTVLLPTA